MKKLLALVLTLALTLTASFALADTLTMATNVSFPPYEFYDGETAVGIDVDIAAAICEKLGYELKVSDMDFGACIGAVQAGKADFCMAGLTVTEERAQLINFSDSYATGIQSIIVKEGSPIATAADLTKEGANVKVGVQQDTTGDIYTTGDIEDAGFGTISRYQTGNDAVMALVSDKVDCVVIDNAPAKAYVEANQGLKILDTEYIQEAYAAAIAKDNTDLLDKFNTALKELIADGTVQTIIEKYIPVESK